MTDPSVELALAELKRTLDVGFTKTDGQLALLLQRTEAVERRVGAQDAAIDRLDVRVDEVEATRVTRADLDKEMAKLRAERAEERTADNARSDRRVKWVTVWLTVVFSTIGIVLTIVSLIPK